MNVEHLTDEMHPHVVRVGWSADDTSMQLGKKLSVQFLTISLFLLSN